MKRFLGGSSGRLIVFIVGLVAFLGGSAYVLYVQLGLAHWRTTTIIQSVDTRETCRLYRGNNGTRHEFMYAVNGTVYKHVECINGPVGTRDISYDPADPAQAGLNTPIVWWWLAFAVAGLGAIGVITSIFASDTAESEKRIASAAPTKK